MKNEIKDIDLNSINIMNKNQKKNTLNKDIKLELLSDGNYYIAFNEKQDIPIWNYLLSEDKTKIFIYDEDDNTIYDELVIDAPDDLFKYGECFCQVSFNGLNLDDNIVTRKNFYLFKKQISSQINIGD